MRRRLTIDPCRSPAHSAMPASQRRSTTQMHSPHDPHARTMPFNSRHADAAAHPAPGQARASPGVPTISTTPSIHAPRSMKPRRTRRGCPRQAAPARRRQPRPAVRHPRAEAHGRRAVAAAQSLGDNAGLDGSRCTICSGIRRNRCRMLLVALPTALQRPVAAGRHVRAILTAASVTLQSTGVPDDYPRAHGQSRPFVEHSKLPHRAASTSTRPSR